MSLLIDTVPKTVNIDETEVRINSDYRTSILFEQMMFDSDFPEQLKVQQALQLYYPIIPNNAEQALEKLICFYAGGRRVSSKDQDCTGSTRRYYDYEYDDGYIYAAFLQQYRIDLESIEYLHWWKFRALFGALSDNCEIVKIMGYRAMQIDSKMSATQKQFYCKMKKNYALPKSKSETEKITEIETMLMK